MGRISEQEIKHLAKLSALEFTDKEIQDFAGEFNSILEFVDQIASAKIDKIPEVSHEVCIDNLRDDVAKKSHDREVLLKNAPKQRKGYLNVPKVVE